MYPICGIFGDGDQATSPNPTHTYTEFGNYIPTLTVTDANGCSRVITNNPVVLMPMDVEITSDPVEGCTPLSFTTTESNQSIGAIVNWTWSVTTNSNTYVSTNEQGNFVIPDTGVWDLILVIENSLGCLDTIVETDYVTVGIPPVIDFTTNTIEECIEVDISFTNLSSPFAEEFLWQFGDGEESVEPNPFHSYMDTGYYDITLTAIHNGCANSATVEDYLLIKEPLAKFDRIHYCEDFYACGFY